jgi:hypothetical protein
MQTTQVSELSCDLDEIIRKHDGRDLTKTEIVRQLATEACVLIENDKDLDLLRLMLQHAVEMAVDYPQTVDSTGRPSRDKPNRLKAFERLGRHLVVAVAHARQRGLEPERVASDLMHMVISTLAQPDVAAESTVEILPRYRSAYDLARKTRDALMQVHAEARP